MAGVALPHGRQVLMPTSRRDAAFLRRMFVLMAIGAALLVAGLILATPKE